DRSDGINSGAPNERDIGAFLLFTPKPILDRLEELSSRRWKGSGDYGAVALGVYSGQGGSVLDENANKHVLARVTWPLAFGDQRLELSAGGYSGRYVVEGKNGVPGAEVRDVRVHGTISL